MGVEGEDRFRNEAGFIQDEYRIEFFEEHLKWLHKGICEGSNCYGFHVWTILITGPWLNEYKNRYGLSSSILIVAKRRKKKSADWLRKLAESNRLRERRHVMNHLFAIDNGGTFTKFALVTSQADMS